MKENFIDRSGVVTLSDELPTVEPLRLPPRRQKATPPVIIEASKASVKRKITKRGISSRTNLDEKHLVRCRVCNARLKAKKLKKHMRKQHPAQVQEPRRQESTSNLKKLKTKRRMYKKAATKLSDTSKVASDTIDGGKYVGQFRRDINGEFGSYPVYDDYGEDSLP